MPRERVVIIGFGWVGQANALALMLDGYNVSVYDPATPIEHYSEYKSSYNAIKHLKNPIDIDGSLTVYMVCVGDKVDEEGNQDISNIKKALEILKGAKGRIVLRSTILPSYLDNLNFDIYLPEFLHEKVAVKECLNPQFMVIGKKGEVTSLPSFIEIWRKRSVRYIECTPRQASHIKYLSNFWNALRIAFVNEFGSSIAEPVDNLAIDEINTVINFIFTDELYGRYGRSFGGHCLPKDIKAYTKWVEQSGSTAPIMRGTVTSNDIHKSRELKYLMLKEWFSNWKN